MIHKVYHLLIIVNIFQIWNDETHHKTIFWGIIKVIMFLIKYQPKPDTSFYLVGSKMLTMSYFSFHVLCSNIFTFTLFP